MKKNGHIDKAATELNKLTFKKEEMFYQALEIVAQYLKITESSPKKKNKNAKYGFKLLKLKKYDKAVEYFKKAIRLTPDFAETYFYLGSVALEPKNGCVSKFSGTGFILQTEKI
jgi:tetratricopeptide (TPR) repeat protein